MDWRRSTGGVLIRLLLLLAALGTLRWAQLTWQDWQREISATFEFTAAWGTWLAAMGLLVVTGILVGAASLAGRPSSYRWTVPLLISVPALLLLGHYVLVMEAAADGADLPWAVDHITFYMDNTSQFVIAVVAGFGIAAGLQPRRSSVVG